MLSLLEGDILKAGGELVAKVLHLIAARPLAPSLQTVTGIPEGDQTSLEETHQYEVVRLVNWGMQEGGDDYIVRPAPCCRQHFAASGPNSSADIYFRMKMLKIDGDEVGEEAVAAVDNMMKRFCQLPIHDNATTVRAIFRSVNRVVIIYDRLPGPGTVLSDCIAHDWVGVLSNARLERIAKRFSKMCHAVELCHQNGLAFDDLNLHHYVTLPENPVQGRSGSVVLSLPSILATHVARLQNVGFTAGTSCAAEDVFKLGFILLQQIYGSLPWVSATDPLYQNVLANPRKFLETRYMALSVDLAAFLGDKVFGSIDQRPSATQFADWVENNLVNSATSYAGPPTNLNVVGEAKREAGYQAILLKIHSLVGNAMPPPPSSNLLEEVIEGFLPALLGNVDSIVKNWSFDEISWLAEHFSFDIERLSTDRSKQRAAFAASHLLCRLYMRLITLPSRLSLVYVQPDGLGTRAEGGFAKVERGHYNGEEVAIKHEKWSMSSDPDIIRLSIVREGLVMFLLNVSDAPRVLPLRGVASLNAAEPPSLVTPWMVGATLKEYLQRNIGKMSDEELLIMMLRMAEILEGLHKRNVVHGDISSRNILMDANGIPWISDLGLSVLTDVDMGKDPNPNAGTLNYLSPELCGAALPDNSTHGSETDGSVPEEVGRTKASDVTALAGVLLEMWTGQKPYYHCLNVRLQIMKGSLPLRQPAPKRKETFWKEVPDALWELLKPCWAMDMSQRPTAAQLAADLRELICNEALRTQATVVAEMAVAVQVDAVSLPDVPVAKGAATGAVLVVAAQLPQPRCRIPAAT